jgi:hypothetical protein
MIRIGGSLMFSGVVIATTASRCFGFNLEFKPSDLKKKMIPISVKQIKILQN